MPPRCGGVRLSARSAMGVTRAQAAGKKVEQGVKTTKEKVREARLEKLAEKQRALSVRGAAVVKQGVLYKLGGTIKIWKKGFWVLVAEPDLELRRFDSMSCAKLPSWMARRSPSLSLRSPCQVSMPERSTD